MRQITAKEPDLAEFRLDRLHELKLLEEVASKKPCRIIATDKSDRSQARKLETLSQAASVGFDLVDIELSQANPAALGQLKSQ
jgi:3-dehydroquinate dehydratase